MSGSKTGFSGEIKWILGLLLFTACFYLFLERLAPYYFLEDDNRDYALPLLAFFYRSLTQGGPAFFNFHQYLGNPCIGASPALYPLIYPAVFLSELFSGGALWSVDILAVLHGMLAASGMYLFAREAGLGQKAAFWAGAVWAINSFALFVSASWWVILPAFGWTAWLHFLLLRLWSDPGGKNMLLTALARAVFFYGGYPQYFVYELIFEVFFISALFYGGYKRENFPRCLRAYAFSIAVAAACALPLALPTLDHMAHSLDRGTPLAYGQFAALKYRIDMWLWGVIYPFVNTRQFDAWGSGFIYDRMHNASFTSWVMPYVGHIGYVTLAALLALYIGFREQVKKERMAMALLLCAAAALAWGAGAFGRILYALPLLNRFRWPFKMGLLFDFYIFAFAAWGVELWLRKIGNPRRAALALAALAALSAADMGLLYAQKYQRGFAIHEIANPIAEPLAGALSGGRIFSLGYAQGKDYDPSGLFFNYATLWGLYHVGGYDAFLSKANYTAALSLSYDCAYTGEIKPSLLRYLRIWGVSWYVVKKSAAAKYGAALETYGIIPKFDEPRRVVFYDAQARPLVYEEASGKSVSFKVAPNRLDIRAELARGGMVVANFLYNPFFVASVDGAPAAVAETKYKQMAVRVPAGKHSVQLIYRNPYLYRGIYWGAAALALLAVLWFLPFRFRR